VTDEANKRHLDEDSERVWRALRRDLGGAILYAAGLSNDARAMSRFNKNWDMLCEHDLGIAGRLYHGLEQLQIRMSRDGEPNNPVDWRLGQMREVLGMVELARERYPGVEGETVGDLVRLVEESIRAEIDEETDFLE
jgi:hypothetical protein